MDSDLSFWFWCTVVVEKQDENTARPYNKSLDKLSAVPLAPRAMFVRIHRFIFKSKTVQ